MRRSVLPLLLVTAIVLVGVGTCRGGDGSGDRSRVRAGEPAGGRAVPETPQPPPRLEDALLTLDDLPEGFVVAAVEDDGRSRTYDEVCGDPDVYGGLRPERAVSALFSGPGGATIVSHELRRHAPEDAAEAMSRLETALARCELVAEHDRTGDVISTSRIEHAGVSGSAVHFQLSRGEGVRARFADVLFVRLGEVLSTLGVYGTGDGRPSLDALARSALRDLADLAGALRQARGGTGGERRGDGRAGDVDGAPGPTDGRR